ncbi:extracellular solute-binding protein family 5 [Beutenbergia cavernae DSM 12333]|uniref:Extracellular solute-binding protein family 5 n=1 Tax=Beutenbergia cavernae (strain ATCC BAA-8 / DSM 12333 / CCUG 43141 / JCM 11478 / NBRC 16432 / NCIMB 13614 / HKI 0122) TaxID=471853 RepID=C5BUT0_BEUC1|nr:ABC transporter substrate-binding protein [Beutenbergia cavernae]ACQ78304.1 extracellular solute-binding protein family 5 [Beutenbergia cavernae DSM 12333]
MSFRTRRRYRRPALLAGAAVAAIALGLTACSSGEDPEGDASGDTGDDGATTSISVAFGEIIENWNPFSPTALQPTRGVIFETLYWYNLASEADPTEMLGAGFEWNEDGTQLTITTREDVQWSDGAPFTANDVAFTFNLIAETPELNTSGTAATAEVVDDTTVVLTFPETSFMQEPSILGNTAIVPEHIWSQITDPTTNVNSDAIGTGPFTLSEFSTQSFVLTANENYWNGAPAVDEVRYIPLESADANAAALVAGEIDWMSAFIPGLEQLLTDDETLSYVNTPALTASIFTCSNADLGCTGPQTDPAVRQAIYWAIDRTQLNELAGGGFAETASPTLLIPARDESWIADGENVTTPEGADVDQANQILDDAGWVLGSDGIREKDGERLSMTIQTVSGWSDFISLNDAMTQQLAEVGIELQPTQVAWNEWNNNQTMGTFQLSLDSIGLGASSNPYFTYNGKYHTANTLPVGEGAIGGNSARYSNPVVDEALDAAARTADEAEQAEQYAIVQTEIVRDLPYIPIYVNSMLTEFNTSRATGWPTDDDRYAMPATWKAWDNGIVLHRIVPAE